MILSQILDGKIKTMKKNFMTLSLLVLIKYWQPLAVIYFLALLIQDTWTTAAVGTQFRLTSIDSVAGSCHEK